MGRIKVSGLSSSTVARRRGRPRQGLYFLQTGQLGVGANAKENAPCRGEHLGDVGRDGLAEEGLEVGGSENF